jgi:hypothetical protein
MKLTPSAPSRSSRARGGAAPEGNAGQGAEAKRKHAEHDHDGQLDRFLP